MWKPQRLIRHLEFCPHALSLRLFSVSSMQPLISTSKPQVNNRHSCSYSVKTDTLTAYLFSKKSNRRVLGNHAHVCSSVTARGICGCLCLFLAICVCSCCLWQTPPSSYRSLKNKICGAYLYKYICICYVPQHASECFYTRPRICTHAFNNPWFPCWLNYPPY